MPVNLTLSVCSSLTYLVYFWGWFNNIEVIQKHFILSIAKQLQYLLMGMEALYDADHLINLVNTYNDLFRHIYMSPDSRKKLMT